LPERLKAASLQLSAIRFQLVSAEAKIVNLVRKELAAKSWKPDFKGFGRKTV
jgi:hypothetical protein